MKRCPLCDFIYEDDQSVCDMDGIELVRESVALVAPARVAAHESGGGKTTRRRLSVLLLVGAVLGGAAFSVYRLSANRDAAGQVLAAPPAATPSATPAATPAPSPAASPANDAEGAAATAAPPAKPSPTPSRPRAAKPKEAKPRPESGNKKDESKVGAFLKKTGRVLKKPFKF